MRGVRPNLLRAAAAVAALAVPIAAIADTAPPDPYEPNNAPSSAYGPVSGGSAYYGSFNGPEADWFWFGATAADQEISISVENLTTDRSPCPKIGVTVVAPDGAREAREIARGGTATLDVTSGRPDDDYALGFNLAGCEDNLTFPSYKFVIQSAQPLRAAPDPCADFRTARDAQKAEIARVRRALARASRPKRRRALRARLARERRELAAARGRYEGCMAAQEDARAG